MGPTTVINGDAVSQMRELKDRGTGNLLVEGSARLVQTLIEHDLVDEYRMMIFPIILGAGKRMFPALVPAPSRLAVTSSQTVGSGVAILTCSPANEERRGR